MNICGNGNCRRSLSGTAYFCCVATDRYCETCSRLYRCNFCHNYPLHKVSLTRCQLCDVTTNLLACECSIMCHPCTFKHPRCPKCHKFYNTISSINPGPKYNSLHQTSPISPIINNYTNNFSNSTTSFAVNQIPFSQPSKKQQPSRQFCSKCYRTYSLDQLFCNINCGHLLCKLCMQHNPKLCPSTACGMHIDIQSSKLFLGLCMECETPLNDAFQGINLCSSCVSRAKQAEKVFERQPSQEVDLDLNKNISNPDLQNQISNQNADKNQLLQQQQKEDVPSNFQQMTIVVNTPNQAIEQKVRANNQITLNSNLSPRGNYLKKLPSINKNLLHPSRVQDDTASSVAKSSKSVARSQAQSVSSQVKKKSRCIFCKIELDYEYLFSFKQCKRSQNKKHRGCMCCLMRTKAARTCGGCLQDQQQELKRKLTYREMDDSQRLRFKEEIKAKGFRGCNNCQVIFPIQKVIEVENKVFCRGCAAR